MQRRRAPPGRERGRQLGRILCLEVRAASAFLAGDQRNTVFNILNMQCKLSGKSTHELRTVLLEGCTNYGVAK
jgi:hypothetical protein